MVIGVCHWRWGDPFPLGWGEWKALSSEPQMAQGNTRGFTRVSVEKPWHDRSYWTGWVKPSWATKANDTIITSGFWATHWRSSSTGLAPPAWLKDYECWNKTLTLSCASFHFYFGFIMFSGTEVLNVQDFLRQIWTLLFLSFFIIINVLSACTELLDLGREM